MAKRHSNKGSDLEALFLRMEELILANSAEDPFEVVFKLLIAKLWDERSGRERRFFARDDDGETTEAVDQLLREADIVWPGVIARPIEVPLTPSHMAVCVGPLARVNLSDASMEVMDALFEFLVAKAAKGAKGQYFTPRHVVEFCVRCLSPQVGELVADPACGSGGFLFHALDYARQTHGLQGQAIVNYAKDNIWGFDFDQRATRVARALLVFAGAGGENVYRVNSLLQPDMGGLSPLGGAGQAAGEPLLTIEDVCRTRMKKHRGFDVILTNPPFAGEVKEQEILNSYTLGAGAKRVERDVLFIERCVGLLRPGGRMAMVLPDNKFSARSYKDVREWLLKRTRVLAVVGLGRHTFLPHTHQKTSILFLQRRDSDVPRDHNIFFAISEREGKNSKGQPVLRDGAPDVGPAWTRLDHDLGDIHEAFRNFCDSESPNLWGT